MFSKHIIKQSISSNWKLWTILTGGLVLITALILLAFTQASQAQDLDVLLPVEQLIGQAILTPTGMGGFLMLILAIVIGNKLVAKEVDSGSLSFALNTQTTRAQILFSKAIVYFCMFLLYSTLVSLTAVLMSNTSANVKVDIGKVFNLAIGFVLYSFAISSFCFAASCWFDKVSWSLLVGAGIPVLFTILGMIVPALTQQEQLQSFFKSITVTTLFDAPAILNGENVAGSFVALALIGALLYTVGIVKFLKKDLPL